MFLTEQHPNTQQWYTLQHLDVSCYHQDRLDMITLVAYKVWLNEPTQLSSNDGMCCCTLTAFSRNVNRQVISMKR